MARVPTGTKAKMKPSIGKTESGSLLEIDVPRLLLTRMLLQADSGGGKTVALKRILEQTHGHVQQIIIDPEGEFSTLREKFDYLLCAPEGADAIANAKTAAILARKLRETRVSAVIDIYDLRPQEQKHFVRLFVEELLAAPKSLWNPCLLVIDEAQIFAPENDKAESHGAIMDLRGRGRKRGLCPILATPRLAELSKDACAGLQNKLIGVTTLDLDVKRAARDLSLTPLDATTLLRNLDPGEFYCFGPALTRKITKVKVGALKTSHGQHQAGKDTRPPAPSEKIKSVLAKLADLPKEAEQEAHTLADFKAEVTRLKRELTLAKQAMPKAPATKVTRIEVPVLKEIDRKWLGHAFDEIRLKLAETRAANKQTQRVYDSMEKDFQMFERGLDRLAQRITDATNTTKGETANGASGMEAHTRPPTGQATAPIQRRAEAGNGAGLTPMDRSILSVLAQFSEGCLANKLVLLAGYTLNGSTRNSFSKLRTLGFIAGGNTETMRITQGGLDALGLYKPLPEGNELRHYWLSHKMLTPMDRAILLVLINSPDGMEAESLCVRAGYTLNGSTRNSFSKLRTAGLIEGKNTATITAVKELLQ